MFKGPHVISDSDETIDGKFILRDQTDNKVNSLQIKKYNDIINNVRIGYYIEFETDNSDYLFEKIDDENFKFVISSNFSSSKSFSGRIGILNLLDDLSISFEGLITTGIKSIENRDIIKESKIIESFENKKALEMNNVLESCKTGNQLSIETSNSYYLIKKTANKKYVLIFTTNKAIYTESKNIEAEGYISDDGHFIHGAFQTSSIKDIILARH